MTRAAVALTSFIFFLSGVAALIFEALWFRQAGLAFGNSVWASAIVVSSYMAGLAVGNGLAARYGQHLKNAIAVYAGLEVLIAVSGVALVMLLPSITTVVASLLRPLFETSTLVHSARFLIGFVILLAPAIAMGATMPVLVRAVAGSSRSFGQVLGLLYGANTLGAVVGAVTSEFIWTPRVGIIGSALVAASFNLLAAALAIGISRRTFQVPSPTAEPTEIARPPISLRAYLLLLASFGTGGILLALEIVWFRILKLFLHPLPEVFATLLAIVLAGIGLGGLLASVWLRLQPSAHKYVSSLALASGILTIVGYVSSQTIAQTIDRDYDYFSFLFNLSIPLMLGVSLLSGVLFPLLGQRLRNELNTDVGSAGLLTLANTAGATVGPLAAAFVLLPRLGMERSILFLALAYGGVAILALTKEELRLWNLRRPLTVAALGIFAAVLLYFPSGILSANYQKRIIGQFPDELLLQVREGPLQTTAYTQMSYLGQPEYHRLMTDTYSMSGTNVISRRYMSLYTYIPLALHPGASDALLISFGVGTTAKSLTDTEEFDRIDVVDISRDVIDMSHLSFDTKEHPLNDPRVKVHIEDGRYFLKTTERRYDLITAEPPPPVVAGVVNLYTQEYFELVRARLKEGGLVSHWLPIINYTLEEAKSTVKGFCLAFPDCTLWDAAPREWTLVGSKNAASIDEETVRRQWKNPKSLPGLKLIGIERAEQLAALFIADADYLANWTRDALPLVDNWPRRGPRRRLPWTRPPSHFAELLRQPGTRDLFESSAFIRSVWPESFRQKSLPYFELQELTAQQLHRISSPQPIGVIHRILSTTDLETLPLWMLGTTEVKYQIASRFEGKALRDRSEAQYQLGLEALASRDYAKAAEFFGSGEDKLNEGSPQFRDAFRIYALCMAGDVERARIEARDYPGTMPQGYWKFMDFQFGVDGPPEGEFPPPLYHP